MNNTKMVQIRNLLILINIASFISLLIYSRFYYTTLKLKVYGIQKLSAIIKIEYKNLLDYLMKSSK